MSVLAGDGGRRQVGILEVMWKLLQVLCSNRPESSIAGSRFEGTADAKWDFANLALLDIYPNLVEA